MPLSDEQKKVLDMFLNPNEKNILVLAPAGTGKTFCSIYYSREFVEKNQLKDFEKILILTFSRNARAQIIKELQRIPRESKIYNHIEITNYHSFMKNYIDRYRDIIGITNSINVLDDDEFISDINAFYNRNNDFTVNLEYLSDFDIISDKLMNVNPKTKMKNWFGTERSYLEIIDFIKATGKIYFSAFGKIFCDILEKSQDLARYIAHDYPILILDEYQDTDYFQSKFLGLITPHTKNLFFADDCQMIYDFRGACQSRLADLKVIFPNIVECQFNEIFRYKNKLDIVNILDSIRQGNRLDYTGLTNGSVISCNINANDYWQLNRNPALLTGAATMTFFSINQTVRQALVDGKSICVLTRSNDFADRLIKAFINKKYSPRVIADTKEMMFINKQLKKIFSSGKTIAECIPHILAITANCKNVVRIDDEEIQDVLKITYDKLKRKRKDEYKEYYRIMQPYLYSKDVNDFKEVLLLLLTCDYIKPYTNYVRTNYVLECIKIDVPNISHFDSLLLQKQYVNSFSDIVPGLYITTIHQSKGREFDYVCIIDIDNIKNEKNLLYVSHSRMKEKLYPVKFNYVGVRW